MRGPFARLPRNLCSGAGAYATSIAVAPWSASLRAAKRDKYARSRVRDVESLRDRFLFSKVLFGALVLSLVYTASNFVVPYTIPAGTAVGLDGAANRVDNGGLYNTMWFYPQVVYYLGDAQCHQMAARSLWLNGNQMPMDARMTSIYLFANLGLLSAILAAPSTSIAQGLVNALPRRVQAWGRRHLGPTTTAGVLVFLGLLPVAVDGFWQLFSNGAYESTNLKRYLTGIPAGWVGGLLIGVMIKSIRQVDLETAALRVRAREA